MAEKENPKGLPCFAVEQNPESKGEKAWKLFPFILLAILPAFSRASSKVNKWATFMKAII